MKLSLYSAMAVAMIFVSSATNAIALRDDILKKHPVDNLSQTSTDLEHDFLDDIRDCKPEQ